MSRLERSHYETIVAVVDRGSVTKAARSLSITQSAVSHRLAEAERRLGYPLFERRPARPIQATQAALGLYQAAKRAFVDLDRAESDFLRGEGQLRNVVRLGVGSYDCYHWLPGFVEFARAQLPDTLFELVVVGDTPAVELAAGNVDVVLGVGSPEGAYKSLPLFEDELVLITSPLHRATRRDYVEPDILEDEVYLTYSRTPSPGFEFDMFFRPAGITPRTTLVIEQANAIAEMVAAGAGVAALSRWAMSPWLEAGKVAATRIGKGGLALRWRSLLRPGTEADALETTVAKLLERWLSESAMADDTDGPDSTS